MLVRFDRSIFNDDKVNVVMHKICGVSLFVQEQAHKMIHGMYTFVFCVVFVWWWWWCVCVCVLGGTQDAEITDLVIILVPSATQISCGAFIRSLVSQVRSVTTCV